MKYSLKNIVKTGAALGLAGIVSGCASMGHLTDPFVIYSNGRWCPEYRDHPIRTTAILIGEVGAVAAGIAAFGSGGSSSSNTTPADNTIPNNGRTNPQPSDNGTTPTDPDDGGGSHGGDVF